MGEQFYLEFIYRPDLRGHRPPNDYVGPFETGGAAVVHKAKWGPVDAEVVSIEAPDPKHVMSPEEARKYVERRA